jgi:LL-diaminopimelate aminotransferase
MAPRNPCFSNLAAGYLFPEVAKRRREFAAKHPEAKIISLGIGNTTEPLPPSICEALSASALELGTKKGYSGYGDEQGKLELRKAISIGWYDGLVRDDEVFVSDGAKCDLGRLALLFGPGVSVAVQDPAYPVYVDSSVMLGQAGGKEESSGAYRGLTYMACRPENGFFPDLGKLSKTDLIYFCSPNNPTGAVATRAQLQSLVDFARKNRSIILFDAAYAGYIRDQDLPRSIFEIDGAREVAIEINSFSKYIGFTGVRLGWSVVPAELAFDDGTSVRQDWNRVNTTIFNGASNIAQAGGLAMFTVTGKEDMRSLIGFYLENASLIRDALRSAGFEIWGGDNAPYVWARVNGKTSWQSFEDMLDRANIVTTPGSGFGSAGEGFLRFSAFGHREDILEACGRLKGM